MDNAFPFCILHVPAQDYSALFCIVYVCAVVMFLLVEVMHCSVVLCFLLMTFGPWIESHPLFSRPSGCCAAG